MSASVDPIPPTPPGDAADAASAVPAPAPAGGRPSATNAESQALSRDLADFLIELSIALHKNAIYPDGHPLLDGAVQGVLRRLETLLRERQTLSLGVARHQLVIEGVATDAKHPLLRELAQRLHQHHLGAVRFVPGASAEELRDVLRTLAVDPGRSERPLGLEPPDELRRWDHIRLFPLSFEQLELLDGEDGDDGDDGDEDQNDEIAVEIPGSAAVPGRRGRGGGARAAQLWIGLARAALASENQDEAPPSTDPVVVAQAIDEHDRDVAYDQVVVGYLLQIADELKARQGKESVALQRRISRLVSALQPETLQRLLEMGGDLGQRRRFVLDAAQGMSVDAVMELVRAAAQTSQQTVSHSMMRLLSKFAVHAENGTGGVRPQADSALRDEVVKLLTGWELEDPNPDAYRRALENMAQASPAFGAVETSYPIEPERLLAMGLETGTVGDSVWRAADSIVQRRGIAVLLDTLDAADGRWPAPLIAERYTTQEQLHILLNDRSPNFELVERLVTRMGFAAATPLLDALERADDRIAGDLMDLIARAGPEVARTVVAQMPDARWGMQRRLLMTVGRMESWPEGFSPRPYTRHVDPRVRREAYRLLVRNATTRDHAICDALLDGDDEIVRIGVNSAVRDCPPAAVAVLVLRLDDPSFTPELRAAAIRAIASHRTSTNLELLVKLATTRRFRWSPAKLAPKTPELLATLSGLAQWWYDEPEAQRVLKMAAASTDVDIRAAAEYYRGRHEHHGPLPDDEPVHALAGERA